MPNSLKSEASASAGAGASQNAEELATHLFERYHAEIFAYLCRMVDSRDWAQDLAQETFLSAYRARDRIAGLANPRAWLYRIATNQALNGLKRKNRFAWLPWHSEERPSSTNLAEDVGRHVAVQAALATLPADYRAALLLYAHHGLKIAELAEALNISEGTARMRLHRARSLFEQAYRKEEER